MSTAVFGMTMPMAHCPETETPEPPNDGSGVL
jgi:hypothetical protein